MKEYEFDLVATQTVPLSKSIDTNMETGKRYYLGKKTLAPVL